MSNRTMAVVLVCFCLFAVMAASVAYLLQDLPPTHAAARATMVAASSAAPRSSGAQPITAEPQFGPIAFCSGLRDGSVNHSATFPAGTRDVYALWSYQNMADGTPYYLQWFHEDAQFQEETLVWNVDTHGAKGQAYVASLTVGDGGSLPPGAYRLVLLIGEHQVQEATFEILEPEP
jgi:hypothetical protein